MFRPNFSAHRRGLNSGSVLSQRLRNFDLDGHFWEWVSLIFCVIQIALDTLFLYIPVINKDQNCIAPEKRLGTVITPISFFVDLVLLVCIFKRRTDFRASKWRGSFFLLSTLPLPQVAYMFMISTRGSQFDKAMKLSKYFVLSLYMPRSFVVHQLYTEATRTSDIFAEVRWVKIAFNMIFSAIIAHVYGVLWYFFAAERLITCWMDKCKNYAGCSHDSFHCGDSFGNKMFLNKVCPTKTRDPALFDFGMFHDALQSRIVEETNFPKKFCYCFLWGLRNVSPGLFQNLQTSTYIWESLLGILITITGWTLLPILIGNIQIYFQSSTTKAEEMRLALREMMRWAHFKDLSLDLRQQIKQWLQHGIQNSRTADAEILLSILPSHFSTRIRRELTLPVLENIFKGANTQFLYLICDHLKMLTYSADSYLVQEYDQVQKMFFFMPTCRHVVVSTNGGRTSSYNSNNNTDDFCGGELFYWALNYQPHLPTTNITVRASTEVDVFSLEAKDLKNVVEQAVKDPSIKLPLIFLRYSPGVYKRKLMQRFRVITKAIVFVVLLRP